MARRYRRSAPSLAATFVVLLVLVIAAVVHSRDGSGHRVETAPLAGVQPSAAAEAPTPASTTPASTGAARYLSELEALTVQTVDVAGYSRDLFGSGWKDPDRNGCDARNDILARDLSGTTFKPGTSDCVVLSGTLKDPYTGTTIRFERGSTTSEAVQIDHIVPLSWSWSHGAASWNDEERLQFANDPNNLRAVDGPTNGSKSDSGPAQWIPPRTAFACTYVESFIAVLNEYRLTVDGPDEVFMQRTLASC